MSYPKHYVSRISQLIDTFTAIKIFPLSEIKTFRIPLIPLSLPLPSPLFQKTKPKT